MGQLCSRAHGSASTLTGDTTKNLGATSPYLPESLHPSLYQRRVAMLAREICHSPPPEPLETTVRRCIAFCYGVTLDWAPHVRVTVFADNPTEHQTNVPVYETLLCTWGVPQFVTTRVECRPIPGTDVASGRVATSPFWSRTVNVGKFVVPYRDVLHALLLWFVRLLEEDSRKQLLINILLQLHEACFNCIGRHKEVFEYCVHDLIEAEKDDASAVRAGLSDSHLVPGKACNITGPTSSVMEAGAGAAPVRMPCNDLNREGAKSIIRQFASRFLDKHKRDALHAAFLSPLKFICQHRYEVFENIDSHGASFWSAVLTDVFFPGLEMPFESIVGLDGGWAWAAVDFLPLLRKGDGQVFLERVCKIENFGGDWRLLSKGCCPPNASAKSLPELPFRNLRGFATALADARKEGSRLRTALEPYVARFSMLMTQSLLLTRGALLVVAAPTWDVAEGPALCALNEEIVGEAISPADLRLRLVGDCVDASSITVDTDVFGRLLRSAGVQWA